MPDKSKDPAAKPASQAAIQEKAVLEFWQKAKTFEKSIAKAAPRGDYVFYDGPPFATGLPHYGHIVASIIKDAVPRYWTMRGYRVERKWGWDCHGLPIENIVEKEMKTKSKQDIEAMGVDKFNEACRSKVMAYAEDWKEYIQKLGRWVDMEDDYKTMDPDFMESVWWVFKTLWDKGLVYKDYRSMHICPRCETTLSQSEVTEGYKDVKDLSCIAKFELADEPGAFILAWTTTPWTLIGNTALAVNKEVKYQVIAIADRESGKKEKYIAAKDRTGEIFKDKEYKVIKEISGSDLIGQKYKPLFDYYAADEKLANRENGWQVYTGDFVSTEEGTGVVHIAPAFGDDDMKLGREHNLPFVQHVGLDGHFRPEVKDFAGAHVKPIGDHMATDIEIIKHLARHNLLFHKEKYEHSYPHCWRCDTPLLNYATSSWFVDVAKMKDKLLANAERINWSPEHIKAGRWGKWLEGARDWSISRQRFWASAIPIWECACGERKVIGSIAELEKLGGTKVQDLHKHIVDGITFACGQCGGSMRRIPDVFDCWFESGSMPYAQLHYPFENKEKFERNFPAEFIAEGADQCRAWFYYLHILGEGARGVEAFRNVIVNGIVLAEDGKKMSKKLQNYPDPMEVFDRYGADSLRYYLLTSPVMLADTLCFSEKSVKEALQKINMTLLNVLKFYLLFAEKKPRSGQAGQGPDAGGVGSENILDRWILARLSELSAEVTAGMESYNLPKASRPISGFIDDLSTWYIRRSRDRFKSGKAEDRQAALDTTRHVLIELAKLMAPFTPFLAEQVWQQASAYNFSDPEQSVHLEAWPHLAEASRGGRGEKEQSQVLEEMAATRKIVELALKARDEAGIKVRQPLSALTVVSPRNVSIKNPYIELVKDEVNVKEVKFKGTSDLIAVALDTKLSPELKQEGLKRELVRLINAKRKKQGLTINDKIRVRWQAGEELARAIAAYQDELLRDTLASEFVRLEEAATGAEPEKINELELILSLEKTA